MGYFKEHFEKDEPSTEGEFNRLRRRIEKKLRKEREKKLSDEFIAGLRKKADIWINQEVVDAFDPEKNYTGKASAVARVDGTPIPVDDYLNDMRQAFQRQARMFRRIKDQDALDERHKSLKKKTLDRLIMYELVEQEALRRDYLRDLSFVRNIEKRKEALLVNEFKAKLIYPLTIATEKELTQYYDEHIDEFKKGYEVWVSEMQFSNQTEAENILKELRQGAGFEFLAARVSGRNSYRKGGRGWVRADGFSPPVRESLDQLKVGEISDVIEDSRQFKIIKLKGKRGGEPIEFSKVVDKLRRIVGEKKFKKVLSEYLAKVREGSKIKIYQKALKRIEEEYWKDTQGPAS